jgi:E-phenylitaconyl-CoA hydratase
MGTHMPDDQSAAQEVLYEVEGNVATVRLNRPHRGNAFTRAMVSPLLAAWHNAETDPRVRALIITGMGDRHFCTGADVREVAQTGDPIGGKGGLREAIPWSPLLAGVTKPVICAVNGMAVGGGLHFVVDADIVVAGRHVEFFDSHTRVGMAGTIENIGLSRRLPVGTALRMTLEGPAFRLSAERAFNLGLVDELCEPGAEYDTAVGIAGNIAQNSPTANRVSKTALWRSNGVELNLALELGLALSQSHRQHPDFVEGPRAFAEGRAPRWVES